MTLTQKAMVVTHPKEQNHRCVGLKVGPDGRTNKSDRTSVFAAAVGGEIVERRGASYEAR